MGHALNNSIQDCLIRFNRMRGRRAKWILGTDHAGIATQTQVERAVARRGHEPRATRARGVRRARVALARGLRRPDHRAAQAPGRLAATTRTSGSRSTTATPARSRTCSSRCTRRATSTATATWSTGTPAAARRSPTSRSRSARSPTRSTTSTTRWPRGRARSRSRPCDRRRCWPTPRSPSIPTTSATRGWSGEKAILPLVGRKLKIIADEYVKPEFGTGALKITPGHDPNDFEIGRRHGLAADQRDRRGRPDDRRGAGAVRRHDRRGGPRRGRRRVAPRGPDRAHRGVRPRSALLAALGRADRAADLAAVVHAHGRVGQAGDRGRPKRAGPLLARELHPGLPRLDGEHPAVGASRASCGGVTGSPSGTAARRSTSAPTRARGRGLGAGPRRARHVVQLGALCPFADARLARGHPRAASLLPDRRPRAPAATSSSSGSRG